MSKDTGWTRGKSEWFRTIRLLLLLLLSHFSRVRLCDPTDGSPPGSPVPGILQARTLEWVAISFSNAWKWKVKVKSLSCVWLLATPWTAAYQAPPSMGFSKLEYWSGVPLPSPRTIRNLLYKPISLSLCVLRIRVFQISFHTEYMFTEIYIIKPCQSKVSIFIIKT